MGVSIEQWQGSIGRFNAFKYNPRSSTDRCKHFLLLEHTMRYFAYLEDLRFAISLIFSIILLFGFCLMITLLLILATLVLVVFWTFFSDSFLSCGNISLALYMIFLFPKFISLPFRNCACVVHRMKINIAFLLSVVSLLLIMAGIETNPGPNPRKNLSFAVWNLDSLPARDYARIPLIESFQAEYKFDIFGVCESALTSGIPKDSIVVDGFSPDPIRADKADDTRNGGVVLYYREDLPIKSRSDLATLPETIVAEIKLNKKKIFSFCHTAIRLFQWLILKITLVPLRKFLRKSTKKILRLSFFQEISMQGPLFFGKETVTLGKANSLANF